MSDTGNQEEIKTKSLGKGMSFIAWIIALILASRFFANWEESQTYPNQNPVTTTQNGQQSLHLKQDRKGHYTTPGLINGKPVMFLLDTGATEVVIPAHLASTLGLPKLGRSLASTANGTVEVYSTVIENLSFGGISLRAVRASLNPAMDANQEILLGMSALKHLSFRQENRELVITQNSW